MATDPNLLFAKEVMPLYLESARNYAQLSIGALVLSVAFREKVFGDAGPVRPAKILVAAWAMFLSAIGSSAWYQYVGVKLIEYYQGNDAYRTLTGSAQDLDFQFPLSVWFLWPAYAYGAMVLCFFAGAVLFVSAAAQQLLTFERRAPDVKVSVGPSVPPPAA
jgi:hypothetical protein